MKISTIKAPRLRGKAGKQKWSQGTNAKKHGPNRIFKPSLFTASRYSYNLNIITNVIKSSDSVGRCHDNPFPFLLQRFWRFFWRHLLLLTKVSFHADNVCLEAYYNLKLSAFNVGACKATPEAVEKSPECSPSPTFQNMAVYGLPEANWESSTLSFCVVGASGDLAKKKIFPALFALYLQGMMPKNFRVFGYARSALSQEKFREVISTNMQKGKGCVCHPSVVECSLFVLLKFHLLTLKFRARRGTSCREAIDTFLSHCFYQPGQYDSERIFHS